MAKRAGHIDILNRDPSARRENGLEPAEDLFGLAHMRQQKARVDEGERAAVEVDASAVYEFDCPPSPLRASARASSST